MYTSIEHSVCAILHKEREIGFVSCRLEPAIYCYLSVIIYLPTEISHIANPCSTYMCYLGVFAVLIVAAVAFQSCFVRLDF